MKQVKKHVEEVAKKELSSYLNKLPEKIKTMMDSALLSLLGLEKRNYNEYEIDHCNSRASVLIDVIRDMAKDEAKKLIKPIKLKDDEVSLIKQAILKEFRYRLEYEGKEIMRSFAKQKVEQYIKELEPDFLKEIGELNKVNEPN